MATIINAGRVGLVYKGEFQIGTPYTPLDVVTENGTSYIVINTISASESIENVLRNSAYAKVLASKGLDGTKGDKGDKGNDGLSYTPTSIGLVANRPVTATEGQSYLATDEGKIYFWSDSSWGEGILFGKGDKGDKGIDGTNGVNGTDGINGKSITNVKLTADGELVVSIED